MKTHKVVQWEELQVLLSQWGGESLSPKWGLGFSLEKAKDDLRVLCDGNPKIELKKKKGFILFVSPEWFHLSWEEDIWVKSLTSREDFTWESSYWCVLRGTLRMDRTWGSISEEVNVTRATSLLKNLTNTDRIPPLLARCRWLVSSNAFSKRGTLREPILSNLHGSTPLAPPRRHKPPPPPFLNPLHHPLPQRNLQPHPTTHSAGHQAS